MTSATTAENSGETGQTVETDSSERTGVTETVTEIREDQVIDALRAVVDPEIQMNIIDLGLVYEVLIEDQCNVLVRMSLTSPGCPFGPEIVRNADQVVRMLDGVGTVEIEIVWDPPWTPEKMSEDARTIFGY